MSDPFDVIRVILEQPDALATLLQPDAPLAFGDRSHWQRLAQYYPAHAPRVSYRVTTGAGSYFVKLNAAAASIQREAHMLRLLANTTERRFRIPDVVDVRLDVPITQTLRCSWIAMTWREGQALERGHVTAWTAQIAEMLANLHALPVDYEAIGRWYGLAIPAPAELAERAHDLRFRHLTEAIESAAPLLKDLLAGVARAWRPLSRDLISLAHGDFHFDNVLRCDAAARPESLMLLDWEDGTLDHPLSDVAHLVVDHVLLRDESIPVRFVHAYWRAARPELRSLAQADLARDLMLLSTAWVARALRHQQPPYSGASFPERALAALRVLLREENWHE